MRVTCILKVIGIRDKGVNKVYLWVPDRDMGVNKAYLWVPNRDMGVKTRLICGYLIGIWV